MKKRISILSILLLFSLLLLFFITNAMSPSSKYGLDSGLFTDNPCSPPCWNNLTPNVTTLPAVNQFIDRLDKQQWQNKKEQTTASGCKQITLTDKPGFEINSIITFNIRDNVLYYIESGQEVDITLGAILKKLGPPEYVKSIIARGPETDFYMLDIYYPHKGVAFDLIPDQNSPGEITPKIKVNMIFYFPEEDIKSYLQLSYLCYMDIKDAKRNAERDFSFLQQWEGLGKIEVKESR